MQHEAIETLTVVKKKKLTSRSTQTNVVGSTSSSVIHAGVSTDFSCGGQTLNYESNDVKGLIEKKNVTCQVN